MLSIRSFAPLFEGVAWFRALISSSPSGQTASPVGKVGSIFALPEVWLLLAALVPGGRVYASTTYNNSIVAVAPAAGSRQVVTAKRVFGTVVRTALTAQELSSGMELSFALKLHNKAELEARVARGEILSHNQLEPYLPTSAEYGKVRAWLKAQGFAVSLDAGTRHAVFVTGSVSRVTSKLNVIMARVATRDGEFTSAITAPQLPDDIAPLVEAIRGLQPHLIRHPAQPAPQQLEANSTYTITPGAIANVYQAPGNLTGAGQTIAVIGDSSVTSSDVTKFWQECGISQSWGNVTQVSVGTGSGSNVINQFEVSMDVEWTSGLAPGAQIRVYEVPYPLTNLNEAAAYTQILNDLPSNPNLHQVTESYGGPENGDEATNGDSALLLLTAQGVTCFAASGDSGSNPDTSANPSYYNPSSPLAVNYPASDPYMTAVGGTTLNFPQSLNGQYSPPEVAWSVGATGSNGTGGGFSSVFARPSWQTAAGMPGGSMRTVPDVSAMADSGTGPTNMPPLVYQGGQAYGGGGTSLSSPVWAALCTLINQARANASLAPVGYLNPKLYALAGSNAFTDITSGSNGAYSAGSGYDLCTGLGTPLVGHLISFLTAPIQVTPAFTVNPSSQTVSVGQTATFNAQANGTPTPTFQWQRLPGGSGSWVNLTDDGTYSGTASTTLSVLASSPFMTWDQFRCVATNSAGSATSFAATLYVNGPPVITAQPQNLAINATGSGNISVSVMSYSSVSYQWYKDGVSLGTAGQNGSFGFDYAQASDAGSYYITLTNPFGTVTSNTVTVTVSPLSGVVSVQGANSNSVFERADGSWWLAGANILAQGSSPSSELARPLPIEGSAVTRDLPAAPAIFAIGYTFQLFLLPDGQLWCMGLSLRSQVTGAAATTGLQLLAVDVSAVAAGVDHLLFIKTDGSLWAAGANIGGPLGDGTTTYRDTPAMIATGVVAVSTYYEQSCFIRYDGTLWTMGNDFYGALGNGSIGVDSLVPEQIATGVKKVFVGRYSTFFIKQDCSLWAMGANSHGELGDGTTQNQASPVQIDTNVVSAISANSSSLYLKADGTLYGVGANWNGELLTGTTTPQPTPVPVATDVVAATTCEGSSYMVKRDGSLWSAGLNQSGQLGGGLTTNLNITVTQEASGTPAAPVTPTGLTATDGTLVGLVRLNWLNTSGATSYEVWRNTSSDFGSAAKLDGDVENPIYFDQNTTAGQTYYYWVRAVNCGGTSAVSTACSGTSAPAVPPSITAQPASITNLVGNEATFAASANGDPAPIYQWQRLAAGTTGWVEVANVGPYSGATSPVLNINPTTLVMNGDQFRCVATNSAGAATSQAATLTVSILPPVITTEPSSQTVAIGALVTLSVVATSDEAPIYQWQHNGVDLQGATSAVFSIANFQSGDAGNYEVLVSNSGGNTLSSAATLTVALSPTVTTQPQSQNIYPGLSYILSVAASGASPLTYQWSKNDSPIPGATGSTLTLNNVTSADAGDYQVSVSNSLGSTVSAVATLTFKTSAGVVSVATGTTGFTLFIKADGSLWGVGNNLWNQLGNTGSKSESEPVNIATGVCQAAGGETHSIYLQRDGSVWTIGDNSAGQLGDGTTVGRSSAVKVATGAVQVAAGDYSSYYLKSDGTLWGMGNNTSGQLGIGSTTSQSTPVLIATNVVSATAGSSQAYFVKTDGSLWAMGDNTYGELGDGTRNTNRLTPVAVATGAAQVSSGGTHTVFVKHDGNLWGMGLNTYGQLATAVPINNYLPTPTQIASGVVVALAGNANTLFLKSDGTLWGLGGNQNGQLGLTPDSQLYVAPVEIATGVVMPAADYTSTLWIDKNGSLWGTGDNSDGQLGAGSETASNAILISSTQNPLDVPAAPTNLAAFEVQPGEVRLTWSPVLGVSGYEVWRGTVDNSSTATLLQTSFSSAITGDQLVPDGVFFYWVSAINPAGTSSLSMPASNSPSSVFNPTITTQPASQSVLYGSSVVLTATVAGTAPFTYQWRKGGSNLADGGNVSGTATAILTITPVQVADTGSYDVVVTNAAGSVTSSSATLTVSPLTQTITFSALPDQPYTSTPIDLSAVASSGLPVSFSVISGPATASGNFLTLTGVGSVTVEASQSGNANFTPAPIVDRSFNVTPDLAAWQLSHFTKDELANNGISGPNAIYGQDGLTNLVKYTLGLDPKLNITTGLPAVTTDGTNWIYTFTKPTAVTDVQFTVEVSTDLVNWSSSGVTLTPLSSVNGTDTWQATYPVGSTTSIFFHLKVSQ